mgnify:FL=1
MHVSIIGGGIGGLSVAIALERLGFDYDVYEQASSFQPIGSAIGLGSNAMLALRTLGVGESVLQEGMPLHEQRFIDEQWNELNRVYLSSWNAAFGRETITMQRADRHEALYDALPKPNLHLNARLIDFKKRKHLYELQFANGKKQTTDIIIAADGIHSLIRQAVAPHSKKRYSGYTCWRGIAKNKDDIPLHISHEAWSTKGRIGWAPMSKGNAYWFACINAQPDEPNFKRWKQEDVAHHFSFLGPVVERMIAETPDHYFLHHDLYDVQPLQTFVYDRIVLLGDAAHATTPNMGQGAGQAIEDAFFLYRVLKKYPSIEEAFRVYDEYRVPKTKKVTELSRFIGWASQWESPFWTSLRNKIFQRIPTQFLLNRLHFLFKD